jgi:hypothetical protein
MTHVTVISFSDVAFEIATGMMWKPESYLIAERYAVSLHYILLFPL